MATTDSLPIDTVDAFGPMVSRGDVVNAILAQLQDPASGIVWYLAERERRTGLPPRQLPVPPSPASFRGGLDFETWGSDELPLLIVMVQRDGAPERFEQGRYEQAFECQLAAVVERQSEQEAIDLADDYGIALAMCIGQNPALGGLAVEARMTDYPVTEFYTPDRRTICRSRVTYRVVVDPVFDEHFSPATIGGAYGPATGFDEITQVELILETDSLDGTQSQSQEIVVAPVPGADD